MSVRFICPFFEVGLRLALAGVALGWARGLALLARKRQGAQASPASTSSCASAILADPSQKNGQIKWELSQFPFYLSVLDNQPTATTQNGNVRGTVQPLGSRPAQPGTHGLAHSFRHQAVACAVDFAALSTAFDSREA